MNSFFRRHRATILWAVLGSFVIGSVILFAFNRIFYSRPQGPAAEVVLVVDGVEITRGTLDKAYSNLVDTYTQFYRSLGLDFSEQLAGTDGIYRRESLMAQAAEGLIYQVIVQHEARRLGISVSKAELRQATEERYQNYLKSLGVTEAQFQAYLASRGMSLAQFKDDLRSQVRAQLLEEKLRTYIVGPIEPTDEELKAYYEKTKSRYLQEPEKVKLAYILIKGDEELANEVLEKAKAPDADFSALVAEYSQDEKSKGNGGVVDWFARGGSDLPPEVEDKAFALSQGDVALVKVGDDYYIVKLLGKKDAVYKPFSEVKDELKKAYIQEKEREKWDQWVKEQRARVKLEVQDPVLYAFILQTDGKTEEAIAELREAQEKLYDPNIDYYLGRLYEALYMKVGSEIAELEKKENPSDEDKARLDELKKKRDDYKRQAVTHYVAFAQEAEADEALYRRILSLDPNNAYAHLELGDLLFAKGQYIEAEREYEQAAKADPKMVEAVVGQGNVSMAVGVYDRAVEFYRKALELSPNNTTIELKLAEAYLKDEKLPEAEATLREILGKSPDNDRALKLMGDLLMAEGKPKDAVSYYEKAVEKNPAWDYRLALGDAYKAIGDLDKARELYEDVKKRYPYQYEPYERLGDLAREEGDVDKAVFWYEEALKRTTDTLVKEAIAKKIVDLVPDDLKARYRLATYYYENYKYSAAIEQYKYILDHRPGDIDAILGIGDCYVKKAEYDEAVKYYKLALDKAPNDEVRLEALTRIIDAEAKRVAPEKKLTPVALEALWQRAQIYKRRGDLEKAKADLKRIYDADPTFHADQLIPLLKELGVEVTEQTASQTPSETAPAEEGKTPQTPSDTAGGG